MSLTFGNLAQLTANRVCLIEFDSDGTVDLGFSVYGWNILIEIGNLNIHKIKKQMF